MSLRCKHCGSHDIEAGFDGIAVLLLEGGIVIGREFALDAKGWGRDDTNASVHFEGEQKPGDLFLYVDNGAWAGLVRDGKLYVAEDMESPGQPARIAWRGFVPLHIDDVDEAVDFHIAQLTPEDQEIARR